MQEKWICVYIAIAGLFIYCNYIVVHIRFTSYTYDKPPEYKYTQFNQYKISTNLQAASRANPPTQVPLKQCCNPLLCDIQGAWRLKHGIRFKELSRVLDTNMELRMRKGWPTNLYHGDLRCGKKYPLPRLIHFNNTDAYYLDITSQCDILSNAPCCRDDVGWCGRGDWFCECDTCLDYDKIIHAELYKWESPSCNLSVTSHIQSCEYLNKTFSSITFIGDSLVRHTFSSLLLHLTNDNVYGALKRHLSQKAKDYCKGENQFVDSACHTKLATTWNEIKNNDKYCFPTKEKIELSFTQAYSTSHSNLALETVREVLKRPKPLIVIGIGVHDNFNSDKVINTYVEPIISYRNKTRSSKPVLIWLNTHAAGPLKPMSYQETQGNKNILKFNQDMKEYCENNSILVFDSFNITKGVHSFDGTHYGSSLNELKVRLLLNGLRSI